MSAVVTSGGKVLYYESEVVTFDLATAIASVEPAAERTFEVPAETRTLEVEPESRTLEVEP